MSYDLYQGLEILGWIYSGVVRSEKRGDATLNPQSFKTVHKGRIRLLPQEAREIKD